MSLAFPLQILEPARNSLPGADGWYPQAPGNVGTKMNGLSFPQPLAGAPGVRTVEYKDEDYATTHSHATVTDLKFECIRVEELPTPHARPNQVLKEVRSKYQQLAGNDRDGVVAHKGELAFIWRTLRPPKSRQDTDLTKHYKNHFNRSSYDYNTQFTPAITVPQLNAYLKLWNDPDNNFVVPWELSQIAHLIDSLGLIGEVDAVGPGETMRTDRVLKDYVCIVERVAKGVSDLWVGTPAHRPSGLLFLELVGKRIQNGANIRIIDMKIRAQSYMSDDQAADATVMHTRDDFQVLEQWFVGTFRSPGASGANPIQNNIDTYVGGDYLAQRMLPQCEITVAL